MQSCASSLAEPDFHARVWLRKTSVQAPLSSSRLRQSMVKGVCTPHSLVSAKAIIVNYYFRFDKNEAAEGVPSSLSHRFFIIKSYFNRISDMYNMEHRRKVTQVQKLMR